MCCIIDKLKTLKIISLDNTTKYVKKEIIQFIHHICGDPCSEAEDN